MEGIVHFAQKVQLNKEKWGWMQDGKMHVILVGTGAPMPDPSRANACTCVIAGENVVIFDVGPGSFSRCREIGIPVGAISAVCITHFHSDHIGELGEFLTLSWATGGRSEPLKVYGPPGIEKVVAGFLEAYGFDRKYRIAHHGKEMLPEAGGTAEAIAVPLPGGENHALGQTSVFENQGLVVQAFNVDHRPVEPAFGFTILFKGRKVVISGDTCKCNSLVEACRDADLLVLEACACHLVDHLSSGMAFRGDQRLSKILDDVKDYHTRNQDAVDIAANVGARFLALSHLVPPPQKLWIVKQAWMWNLDLSRFRGRLFIGEDGMGFTLNASPSKKISFEHTLQRGPPRDVLFFLAFFLVMFGMLFPSSSKL